QADVSNRFFNFGIPFTLGTSNNNFAAIQTAHVNNKAAVLLFGQDTYGTGFAWNSSQYWTDTIRACTAFAGRTAGGNGGGYWTSWYYSGAYPDIGGGLGYNIFGSAATTPNTVGNM